MYAVIVKKTARHRVCSPGRIWVRDATNELYVCVKERGLWATKEEAETMITEPWEVVVYVGRQDGRS